jgi:glutamine amidotransferase
MTQTVAVIDYGMGNLHSVESALREAGASDVVVTSDAAAILAADRIVFPGVGAIRDCLAGISPIGL